MSNKHTHFEQGKQAPDLRHWLVHQGQGPILATAVHAGHQIRDELRQFLHADDATLRRDEDPMTDALASTADNIFINYQSRFEVDLNRPRDMALATDIEQTWGQKIWGATPPEVMVERSLAQHDKYYALMKQWLETLIAEHKKVLVLDIHSYNHRRNGADSAPALEDENPDIDLGLTTLDIERFGGVVDGLTTALKSMPCEGRELDVRHNARYPDGGHWPEWVFANYAKDICTITLEYKKFYMDEWTGQCSLAAIEDLRAGLNCGLANARKALQQCN